MDTAVLGPESLEQLYSMLSRRLLIGGATSEAHGLPTIAVTPAEFVQQLATMLQSSGIDVEHINLEGSAAAACICPDTKSDYVSQVVQCVMCSIFSLSSGIAYQMLSFQILSSVFSVLCSRAHDLHFNRSGPKPC